jgi:hypothetical protein
MDFGQKQSYIKYIERKERVYKNQEQAKIKASHGEMINPTV